MQVTLNRHTFGFGEILISCHTSTTTSQTSRSGLTPTVTYEPTILQYCGIPYCVISPTWNPCTDRRFLVVVPHPRTSDRRCSRSSGHYGPTLAALSPCPGGSSGLLPCHSSFPPKNAPLLFGCPLPPLFFPPSRPCRLALQSGSLLGMSSRTPSFRGRCDMITASCY